MKLLLDTHIFLWFITADSRLPVLFRDTIKEPNNTAFLSVVSLWEIIIKYNLGRLPLPQTPETFVPRQRRLHLIKSLPVTEPSVKRLATLPALHRDPFDRMLISQALSGGLTLITVDTEMMKYNVPFLK